MCSPSCGLSHLFLYITALPSVWLLDVDPTGHGCLICSTPAADCRMALLQVFQLEACSAVIGRLGAAEYHEHDEDRRLSCFERGACSAV